MGADTNSLNSKAANISELKKGLKELETAAKKCSETVKTAFQTSVNTFNVLEVSISKTVSKANLFQKRMDSSEKYSEKLKDTLVQYRNELLKVKSSYEESVVETGRYSEKTQELSAKLNEAKTKVTELQEELKEASASSGKENLLGSGLKMTGKALTGMAKIGCNAMLSLANAGIAALAPLKDVGINCAKMAGEFSQVQTATQTTFGTSSAMIDAWAKQAATSFGLSQTQAQKFSNSMGSILKSTGISESACAKMSTTVTGLASDFAAFHQIPMEDAFEKIQSAIAGESNALSSFGIDMSEASLQAFALSQEIDQSYASMTQAQQATLRYGYLMSKTSEIQGSYAQTSNTLTAQLQIIQAQTENLATSIGTTLLPAAQNMLGTGINMLSQLQQGFEQGGVEGLISAATNVVGQLLNGFVIAAPSLINAGVQILMMVLNGIATLVPALPQQSQTIITSLANGIFALLPTLIVLGTQIFFSLVQGFVSALPSIVESGTNAVLTLGDSILNNLPQILESGTQLLLSLIQGIAYSMPRLTLMGFELIFKLSFALIQNLPQMLDCGIRILSELIAGFLSMMGEWITLGSDLVQDMWNTITETDWLALGANIISGIGNGIINGAGSIVSAAEDAASRALNAAKNFLGIHSPSRVFRDEVGKMIPQGMAMGVETETDKAVRVTRQSASEMLSAAQNTLIFNQARSPVLATAGAPALSRQTAATMQTQHTTVIEMDGRTVAKVITPFVDQFLF